MSGNEENQTQNWAITRALEKAVEGVENTNFLAQYFLQNPELIPPEFQRRIQESDDRMIQALIANSKKNSFIRGFTLRVPEDPTLFLMEEVRKDWESIKKEATPEQKKEEYFLQMLAIESAYARRPLRGSPLPQTLPSAQPQKRLLHSEA